MEQKIVIVGTKFRGGDALKKLARLVKGDAITLQREPDNPHDPGAVACYFDGAHLGYLPKAQYGAIREALDRGCSVSARITHEALMQEGDVAPGGLPRLAVTWHEPAPIPGVGGRDNQPDPADQ